MFDLVYPLGDVPVLPAPSAERAGEEVGRQEMFPVVRPTGEVVGMASREYCHGGSRLLHPVVHLHVIDRNERLYLQKRSLKKDIQPGKWDTAVGGHVDFGEQILEALYRETYEELGFTKYNPVYLLSYEYHSDRENELVNVFAAVGSFELSPDKDEVEEGRWWSLAEIHDNIGNSVFTPNFEHEFSMIYPKLVALL